MLLIPKRHMERLQQHVRHEFPMEACGILAGSDGLVLKVYPMINTDHSGYSYFMDPRDQLRVVRDARREGLSLLAIYHSHVASEAYPSERDRELAFYPDLDYVIISLVNLKRPVMRIFRIHNGTVSEQKFRVVRNER
ncbi:MAG: M67 family metallopeptidase [Armatimonadota bacterium]|nr:MAG: M67 family metallopeptidase [Armatimonadota bacterium]